MDVDAVNLALFLLRGIVGIVMLAHGLNHVFGGGKIEGTAGWFESLGMRPGKLHAWLASLTEIGAGVMLLLGLLTPLAAAAVIGVMLVALVTNHLSNGFFIFRPGEGYEYVLTLTVLGFVIALLGPGEWSLDDPLDILDWAGETGLWIATIGGVGGAAVLLLGFWRPEAEPADGPADEADEADEADDGDA